MRFPVVLFDLDGTVVDSGAIILASMRHATRTVLEREIPDDELMASVGGPGLEAQMRSFGPDRVDELVRVYRAHNEPLHDGARGLRRDRRGARALEGRRAAGSGSSRRSGARRSSSRSRACRSGTCSTRSSAATRPSARSPIPEPLLLALERLGAQPARGRLRRRLAVRHDGRARRRRATRSASAGAASTTATRSTDADVVVDSPEELLAVL